MFTLMSVSFVSYGKLTTATIEITAKWYSRISSNKSRLTITKAEDMSKKCKDSDMLFDYVQYEVSRSFCQSCFICVVWSIC